MPPPAAAPPLPPPGPDLLTKSGRFQRGIGVELLGVGAAATWTRFGTGGGVALTTAMQLDLGTNWALRLPLSIDSTVRNADIAYVGLAFSPGLVHRWRTRDDQRWIPYAGAGLRLASSGVRRDFIGLPLVATTSSALSIGEHHHDGLDFGHHDDPNVDTHGSIAPELWAGAEWHVSRWVALIFGGTYAWIRFDGENVHLVRGTIAVRLTL